MPTIDSLRSLQIAARVACQHVDPDDRAVRVVVFGRSGKLLDLVVPASVVEAIAHVNSPVAGWSFEGNRAHFDEKLVAVSASRIRLLRALVEASGPLTAKELVGLAFDRETDVANVRYHIRELRAELRAAFQVFEGELVVGEGEGYRLVLR